MIFYAIEIGGEYLRLWGGGTWITTDRRTLEEWIVRDAYKDSASYEVVKYVGPIDPVLPLYAIKQLGVAGSGYLLVGDGKTRWVTSDYRELSAFKDSGRGGGQLEIATYTEPIGHGRGLGPAHPNQPWNCRCELLGTLITTQHEDTMKRLFEISLRPVTCEGDFSEFLKSNNITVGGLVGLPCQVTTSLNVYRVRYIGNGLVVLAIVMKYMGLGSGRYSRSGIQPLGRKEALDIAVSGQFDGAVFIEDRRNSTKVLSDVLPRLRDEVEHGGCALTKVIADVIEEYKMYHHIFIPIDIIGDVDVWTFY